MTLRLVNEGSVDGIRKRLCLLNEFDNGSLEIYLKIVTDALNGHCLVEHLLNRRSSIERLMRSLMVVVMHKLFNPPTNTPPTAHPRRMEAVDAHFEDVKSFFDEVSIDVVELTAQP